VIETLRRLNDRERYYGLTWPGWLGAAAAVGALYGAVRLSPFGARPTITVVVLVLAAGAVVVAGLSGQAIGPGRYLVVIWRYQRARKQLAVPERPDRLGLVLESAPELSSALPIPAGTT
jgi:hypothetical protein